MIWLIGNKGMLGADMEKLIIKNGWEYSATDKEVDITNPQALSHYVRNNLTSPVKWIINCSAYTAVDQAEKETETAFLVNGNGTANIAQTAKELNAVLIHFSTDYVFDGKKIDAYIETDPTDPAGAYGKSKLHGEEQIQRYLKQFFIIRTAWLYGKNGKNFVYTMLKLLNEKENLKVVADQWGTPTYTKDLVDVVGHIILTRFSKFGTYHFTNEGKTNWYHFACKINQIGRQLGYIKKETPVSPVTTAEYPTLAKRPANSWLSKEKIKGEMQIEIRNWEEALLEFMEKEIEL